MVWRCIGLAHHLSPTSHTLVPDEQLAVAQTFLPSFHAFVTYGNGTVASPSFSSTVVARF